MNIFYKTYIISYFSLLLCGHFYPIPSASATQTSQKSFVLFEQEMENAVACLKQLKTFLRTSAKTFNVRAIKVSKTEESLDRRLFRIYPNEKEVMHFSCKGKFLKVWYDFE